MPVWQGLMLPAGRHGDVVWNRSGDVHGDIALLGFRE